MKVAIFGGRSPSTGAIHGGSDATRFNPRRFVALTAALSGLCLPFSGLEVHLHQLDSIFSVSRHSWMAIHVALGALFLASVITHATLNRRALANHLFGGAARSALSQEAIAAIVVVASVLLVAATHALR